MTRTTIGLYSRVTVQLAATGSSAIVLSARLKLSTGFRAKKTMSDEVADAFDLIHDALAVFLWGTRVKFTLYVADRDTDPTLWQAQLDRTEDGLRFEGVAETTDEALAWLEWGMFAKYAPKGAAPVRPA